LSNLAKYTIGTNIEWHVFYGSRCIGLPMAPRHSISKLQVSVLKNKDKTIIGISLTVNFTKIHLDVKSILGPILTVAVHADVETLLQATMCTPVSSCSVNRAVSVACQKRTLLKHEEDCDERFRPKNNADHAICFLIIIMPPTVGKRTISVAFVCPSVCLSVCLYVRPSRT